MNKIVSYINQHAVNFQNIPGREPFESVSLVSRIHLKNHDWTSALSLGVHFTHWRSEIKKWYYLL